jgi:hypothetical protein
MATQTGSMAETERMQSANDLSPMRVRRWQWP